MKKNCRSLFQPFFSSKILRGGYFFEINNCVMPTFGHLFKHLRIMQIKSILYILLLCFSTAINSQSIPYRNLFDDKIMPRIDITLPADSLTWLYRNVNYDGNIRANFIFFDGLRRDTMLNVGFRLRGNTSRSAGKKNFKVKFNAYTKGVKYQGVKELNLNGQHNDPTLVREKLYYDVWNAFGLPPRRASFSKVYINGNYFGLYTSIEEMDDEWLKKAYGSSNDTGNLYKCTYPADLKYINDNQTSYKNVTSSTATGGRAYDLKTNELADDYSDLVMLIKKGNQSTTANLPTELSQILDIDQMLKAYAVEVMLGHWDDYAYNKNNYFLYHNPKTNRFEFVSYDTDNTFGIDWVNKDWGNRPIYTWHSPTNGILIENILKVPFYKNRYSFHLKTLMDTELALPKMYARIDSLRNFVRQAASEDTYRALDYGFTMQQFNDNFDYTSIKHVKYGLKGFLQTMRTTANNQLVLTATDPSVLSDDAVKVFPNPTNNQFFIQFEKESSEKLTWALIDINGKTHASNTALMTHFSILTEGLPKGVYVLKINWDSHWVFKKVVLN
ncbi:MAG: CotH kinase family protein [Saprospiraceae bacterium]|nr:CotH kinase family protein [Saprospiraceae bacterium]